MVKETRVPGEKHYIKWNEIKMKCNIKQAVNLIFKDEFLHLQKNINIIAFAYSIRSEKQQFEIKSAWIIHGKKSIFTYYKIINNELQTRLDHSFLS